MRSISKLFFVVVIFLTFIFVSCGGEEPNIPDDESVVDEIVDETLDETVDEFEIDNEIEDDIIETDNEIDEDVDDQEIVYTELESLDDCLDSSCKNLCFLQWDEENEEVDWYEFEHDEVGDSYIFITLEVTSDKRCYTNAKDPYMVVGANWNRIEAYDLPIKDAQEDSYSYYFLSDTDETWQEKKKISFEAYTKCIRLEEDICEKYGAERVQLEGLEGDFMSMFDKPVEFVPLLK